MIGLLFLQRLFKNPNAFVYASDNLRDNELLATAVIKKDGMCFANASERLQNMIELVILAVSKSVKPLIHASLEIFNDPRLADAFETQNREELKFALEALQA
jgi:hypothetical protein